MGHAVAEESKGDQEIISCAFGCGIEGEDALGEEDGDWVRRVRRWC